MAKVIAEIGINHGGVFDKALRLIELAHAANASAVKFQWRDNVNFFAEHDEMGSTLIRSELATSNLEQGWVAELIQKARELDLQIGFSFFKSDDLEKFFMMGHQIDFIKIPSPEFHNLYLIQAAKSVGLPVMISYGGGDETLIEQSIVASKLSSEDTVFHCISNYPIATGNQQLDFLKKIGTFSEAQLGYSSHDELWETSLLALNYGVTFIERHLCETINDRGLDITTSSTPDELKRLCTIANAHDSILRCDRRAPNQGEILNARNLGSGLYFSRNCEIGETVQVEELAERAPATGLRRFQIDSLKSKVLIRPGIKDRPLEWSHFKPAKSVSLEDQTFRDKFQLSLPVRLHDFSQLKEKFSGNYFELHLSYDEVERLSQSESLALDHISDGNVITIHLPDYISNHDLIDPFSKNEKVRKKSLELITQCFNLAEVVGEKTGEQCKVLGSFSQRPGGKRSFYELFKNFSMEIEERHGLELLPQWLPKKAWYFGGSVTLDQFCERSDIELIAEMEIPICLDLAHLILSANYFDENWTSWFKELKTFTKHIHLSDAAGIDSEGVPFGEGDLHDYKTILELPLIKVLEVWEGHHDLGSKFLDALIFLKSQYYES